MIFFMIDNKTRNMDTLFSSQPVIINEDDIRLIAWNDVPSLSTFEKLKSAVMEEWKKDECCIDIIKQAQEMYGIDITLEKCGLNGYLDKNTVLEMMEKVFFNWAHPMVGSVVNSRLTSPFSGMKEYIWQWNTSDMVISSEETIKRALDELGELQNSGLEQVRICSNITELARAMAGELTTQISQDIEKLFALKLSQSDELYHTQVAMLQAFLETYNDQILETIALGRAKLEAVRNLISNTRFIKPSEMVLLIKEFIKMAVDKQYVPAYTGSFNECIQVFSTLIPSARCAVLMKDFSKLLGSISIPEKISIGSVINDAYRAYTLIESVNPQKYVPELIVDGIKLGWNSDEYHTSVKTYRHFLCPLWNGGAGDTAEVLLFWKNILGDKLPENGIMAVAGGLFSLSKLYCDKYKTSEHTLVEIFEATCVKEISCLEKASVIFDSQSMLESIEQAEDAFSILIASKINDWCIDSIALSGLIKKVYFDDPMKEANCSFSEGYAKVCTAINDECTKIKEVLKFELPDWNSSIIKIVQPEAGTYAALLSGVKNSLFKKLKILNKSVRNAIHNTK